MSPLSETMEEGPPPPEDLVTPHTGAPHKRPRADSDATSIESNRSVRTLNPDDLEYVYENGRIYGNDTYYLPCIHLASGDLTEQDRLSLQHQIFVQALQGKLTTTRLLPSTRRILDLGTGPGHWAVAMAQQYPHIEVVGIDMSEWDIATTEDSLGDSRVKWELDNLDVWGRETETEALMARLADIDFATHMNNREPLDSQHRSRSKGHQSQSSSQPRTSDEHATIVLSKLSPQPEPGWNFSQPFELIHLRNMKAAFSSSHWADVYAEIYKSLSPGGMVEVADWDLGQVPLGAAENDASNFPMPTMRKIYAAIMEASFISGCPLGLFYMHPSYLEEAGFVDVQTTHVNVPVGQWPQDSEQRSIGKKMFVLGMELFEPLCLRLLTKWGDKKRGVWTVEEVRANIEVAQGEVREWIERSERGEVEGWCASFKWITGRKSWHAED